MSEDKQLHLPDLTIEGFRGIDSLMIPRLGRVTLIAGKNSVGKTTVLEAVRVYGARARYADLADLLTNREETYRATDEDGDSVIELDWASLFFGRNISVGSQLSIGPQHPSKRLTISLTPPFDNEDEALGPELYELLVDSPMLGIKASFEQRERPFPWLISAGNGGVERGERHRLPSVVTRRLLPDSIYIGQEIQCVSLGPGILDNFQLSNLWDDAMEIKQESIAVEALRLIFGDEIIDVTMVGDDRAVAPRIGSRGRRLFGRRAMVNMKHNRRRVPLRSLGEGAVRLFGVALALVNSKDGFLLIDEAENGLHYSIQADFWRMVLRTAQDNNVQVLATTHSADCIRGFTHASIEFEDVEGVLVHLRKGANGSYLVEYTEEKLSIIADQGIEVR